MDAVSNKSFSKRLGNPVLIALDDSSAPYHSLTDLLANPDPNFQFDIWIPIPIRIRILMYKIRKLSYILKMVVLASVFSLLEVLICKEFQEVD